ncbi:enoyl-CoA hydratase [Sedimentitalea sp. JM2-8]|uniref:Enoyl-CoA hydratase n=1 Tax=Sedimentitalea xiamensis TaxID=3050037 RepID=A0ABT7FC16_9RHOB|nr:enoyl-CoA hydratase [Sedimentitalea xiamensis]MDK3072658.1 enoyl-CoA hydratase [Sedimentitalea xiamensis]
MTEGTAASVVLCRRAGPILEVTLNRPDKMNALSRQMVRALTDVLAQSSRDDDIRAIILTGRGRAFCGGLDLGEIAGPDGISGFQWHGPDSLFAVAKACPHPIISAVNGFAITGGLELALLGDFLIAAETAQFGDTHSRVGITPSWGMTQVLPRLIGVNRARQMSLTGAFIDAGTALAWGLVNEVLPDHALMDRARELAGQIAETDVTTMREIRQLLALSAEHGLTEGMAQETDVFDRHIARVSAGDVARNRARVIARGRKIAGKDKIA